MVYGNGRSTGSAMSIIRATFHDAHTVSAPGAMDDSSLDCLPQHSADILTGALDGAGAPGEIFRQRQAQPRPQFLRAAIKVRGKILFIQLGDVVSVQADGKSVWLQQIARSYLLRESISVVANRLASLGFIRIHRSVLVNSSFVRELRPLSTGEYCLRTEGGKEFTMTRTYKHNLRSLAEFWMGTGSFFPNPTR